MAGRNPPLRDVSSASPQQAEQTLQSWGPRPAPGRAGTGEKTSSWTLRPAETPGATGEKADRGSLAALPASHTLALQ